MISGFRPEYLEPEFGDDFTYRQVYQLVGEVESIVICELLEWLNSRGPTTYDELIDECTRLCKRSNNAQRFLSDTGEA